MKCFSHFEPETQGHVNIMVYNSPGRNTVIFITNSHDVFGRSSETIPPEPRDYHTYYGGHFSREFSTKISRPYLAKSLKFRKEWLRCIRLVYS